MSSNCFYWLSRAYACTLAGLLIGSGGHLQAHDASAFENSYVREKGRFVPLNKTELEQLERLFSTTLSATTVHSIPESRTWRISANGHQVTIKQEHERGGGYYLFDLNNPGSLFLQVPHRKADRHTGTIGYRLFQQGGFRGAAWNSLNRRNLGNANGTSDLAHDQRSPFNAHGQAIARRYPQATIIQLHGFSQDKRRTQAGRSSDIIISASNPIATPRTRAIYRCLKTAQLGTTRLYPEEVNELGGLTNITANRLQAQGFAGFVHLELSAPLRQQLIEDDQALTRLAQCLR